MADAPYKLSRAALRERYGSRSIDASAPQSSRDFTPSGRRTFLTQQAEGRGLKPEAAIDAADAELNKNWRDQFKSSFQPPAPTFSTSPRLLSPLQPNPIAPQLQPPTSLGLLPDLSFGPEMLASFTPSTTSPLNRFQLPSTRLTQPNKWSTNIYG